MLKASSFTVCSNYNFFFIKTSQINLFKKSFFLKLNVISVPTYLSSVFKLNTDISQYLVLQNKLTNPKNGFRNGSVTLSTLIDVKYFFTISVSWDHRMMCCFLRSPSLLHFVRQIWVWILTLNSAFQKKKKKDLLQFMI